MYSAKVKENIEKELLNKTGKLILFNKKLKEIPKEVYEMTWLKTVFLNRNRIVEASELVKLQDLELLAFRKNKCSDFNFLTEMPNLKSIYISNNAPNNITGLNLFHDKPSLRALGLGGYGIEDISYVEKMHGMKYLYLNNNNIGNVNFISNLTHLEGFHIGGNKILDIEPLKKLHKLTDLRLGSNEISDIRVLENLTNLEMLFLNNNEITNIKPLLKLTKLEHLDISSNPINDIETIEILKERIPRLIF